MEACTSSVVKYHALKCVLMIVVLHFTKVFSALQFMVCPMSIRPIMPQLGQAHFYTP